MLIIVGKLSMNQIKIKINHETFFICVHNVKSCINSFIKPIMFF